jgi:signal peptidase I
MTTALLWTLAALLAASVALNGLFLWLSCKICRVARTTRDGRRVGVGYGRALLVSVAYTVVGNALVALASYGLAGALGPSSPWAVQLGAAGGLLLLSLVLQIIFLCLTLRTSLGRGALVALLWTVFSAVFAVLFVFGVREFVAEAFVMPTGAMAETLYGYQKIVECPQCGYKFPVNCSQEAEHPGDVEFRVLGCTCPNCREHILFGSAAGPGRAGASSVAEPHVWEGDRFLVGKGLFGSHLWPPQRLELIAFHHPGDPFSPPNAPPVDYVKRVVGLPGETIAIHGGKLYVLAADQSPKYDDASDEGKTPAERVARMHADDPEARALYEKGKFAIVRKPPALLLAMRHIVYDADHPAKDLAGAPPRWAGRGEGAGWSADGLTGFRIAAPADDRIRWLGYRHILRPSPVEKDAKARDVKPTLITDFIGYNAQEGGPRLGSPVGGEHWVGDLLLECEVQVDQPQGKLTLELSKGPDRFRARFDLADGSCRLLRYADGKEQELGAGPTSLKGGGTHRVRFADCDERLTVWVDDALAFGEGMAYPPPAEAGPTANDLEPAGVGVEGVGATVRHLQLWRDTYYTGNPAARDLGGRVDWGDPTTWEPLRKSPAATYFAQPGSYFVLGDNSPASSDSRLWGSVPERLLIGKPILIYYPFDRFGWLP